jgi:hypothetical protein
MQNPLIQNTIQITVKLQDTPFEAEQQHITEPSLAPRRTRH